MKISTKGRYALRLMLDLANNHQYGYTPVKEISLRQDISDKYLEQIISRLSKAGLVVSARGAQGGYKLAKEGSLHGGRDSARAGGRPCPGSVCGVGASGKLPARRRLRNDGGVAAHRQRD